MRLPNNLGLKIYLIIYTIFSLTGLQALSHPKAAVFTYYNILITFDPSAGIWYVFSVLDSLIGCLIIIPLFRRAFSMVNLWTRLFRWVFYARIATTILGHNYEYLAIRSSFYNAPMLGYITLGVWVLFLYPSFRELHTYAFRTK